MIGLPARFAEGCGWAVGGGVGPPAGRWAILTFGAWDAGVRVAEKI